MKVEANMKAPDFEALDQEGKPHKLADYAGKYVLLYFYPKDDTPGCTVEACSIRDNYGELKKHLEIIGVSADTEASHKKFAQKYNLPFTLLADADKKIISAYGADGVIMKKRVSFLIGPEGIIVKVYEKVVPADHVRQILADMQAR
jgi:peroxiredoxin Q/BCP